MYNKLTKRTLNLNHVHLYIMTPTKLVDHYIYEIMIEDRPHAIVIVLSYLWQLIKDNLYQKDFLTYYLH